MPLEPSPPFPHGETGAELLGSCGEAPASSPDVTAHTPIPAAATSTTAAAPTATPPPPPPDAPPPPPTPAAATSTTAAAPTASRRRRVVARCRAEPGRGAPAARGTRAVPRAPPASSSGAGTLIDVWVSRL